MKATQIQKDFFLEPDDEDDDYDFLAPVRTDNKVLPLVDGISTFEIMANDIASAAKSVNLAAWIINPSLKLPRGVKITTEDGKKKKYVYSWKKLFCEVAKKRVYIRILINDFDPIIANAKHRTVWNAYYSLINAINMEIPREYQHYLQVVCCKHTAKITIKMEDILKPFLKIIVKKLNKTKSLRNFKSSPGLWPLVDYNPKQKIPFSIKKEIEYILYPGSHHQKICIVDGRIGYLGGLDIQKSRYDDRKHRRGFGWHDIHSRIEGTVVNDLERNFCSRWNREVKEFISFVNHVNQFHKLQIPRKPISLTYPEFIFEKKQKHSTKGTIKKNEIAQLHRTISKDHMIFIKPKTIRNDISEGYEKVIESAKSYIYIENQYLRLPSMADWIIDRYKDLHSLQVIIVLPLIPEEAKKKGKIDKVTQHGIFLQSEVINRLTNELDSNIGLFSMGSIYVHSKLLIVDDIYCNISTANLNPRSFEIDTEASIAWYNPTEVRKFRLDLWKELLGNPNGMVNWKPEKFLHHWNSIAKNNSKKQFKKRKGFIVPYKFVKGKEQEGIPNWVTQYYDLDTKEETEEDSYA